MDEIFLNEKEKKYLRLCLILWKQRTKMKFDSIVFMQVSHPGVKVLIDRDFVDGLRELLDFNENGLEEECSYIFLEKNSVIYKLNPVEGPYDGLFN